MKKDSEIFLDGTFTAVGIDRVREPLENDVPTVLLDGHDGLGPYADIPRSDDVLELRASLHVAVLALVAARHEARWTIHQARILDIAIERGSKALGLPVPFVPSTTSP